MFCTTTALQTKMIGTTFNTATTLLAEAAIVDAENEIKKKLSQRYDFSASPFLTTTTIPPIIRTICEWLAIGYTYEGGARGGKDTFARADRFIKRSMDKLTLIADGMAIQDTAGSVIDPKSDGAYEIYSNADDYSTTFNEDNPLNWAIDSDKLDAIEAERD